MQKKLMVKGKIPIRTGSVEFFQHIQASFGSRGSNPRQ
jgi:hypothetical protein